MLKASWGILAFGVLGCTSVMSDGSDMVENEPNGPVIVGTAGKSGIGFGPEVAFQPPLPGAVFTAPHTPPPVSGGTLLVMRDQKTAIVADPDRDQVLVVDLPNMAVTHTITLDEGSEPGRAVDDANGQVHLVLRGSGKLLTLDPQSGEALGTRSVCAYPRGVAVADAEQVVHVACSEGKLVTLSTSATEVAPVRTVTLDHDLRDVVVASDGLWVSRFRAAEVLRLDAAGKVVRRTSLPNSQSDLGESVSSVAYRMIAGANGGVVVVHQRAFAGQVVPSPGGYASSGLESGIVQTAISTISDSGEAQGTSVPLAARLAVDVAQSSATGAFLVASAMLEHPLQPSGIARTLLLRPSDLNFQATPNSQSPGFALTSDPNPTIVPNGQLVAVAFADNLPVLQFREPSRLVFGERGLSLPGNSVEDTGNELFHLQTSSGLACASCHPDGQDDGRVWNFVDFGARRTQSLRGGLLGTEPFHWDGAESDFVALTTDVMQGRMAGPELTADQTTALAHYIDKLPAMPAANAAAGPTVERGKALFNDATVGCATCHSGTRFTNNQTVDVGSEDGYLQVPSLLGVWARAPYLHDGCAKTMADRFTLACDKRSKHGNIAGLTPDDLAALTDYLETL